MQELGVGVWLDYAPIVGGIIVLYNHCLRTKTMQRLVAQLVGKKVRGKHLRISIYPL